MNQWKFHNALTFFRLIAVKNIHNAHEKQVALLFGGYGGGGPSINLPIQKNIFSFKHSTQVYFSHAGELRQDNQIINSL